MKAQPKWLTFVVAAGLLVAALALTIWFFEQLPIEGTTLGLDLRSLYSGLRGNRPVLGPSTGLYISPWIAGLLLPLGHMSFRAAWGVVALATLGALIASVPPTRHKWQRWLGMALLALSFLSLRTIVDGNFEFLIIAGLPLVVQGYAKQNPLLLAVGMLLATAKIQEVWVLMPVLGLAVLRNWPRERWLQLGGWLLLAIVPSMLWLGADWLGGLGGHIESGSIMDSSLVSGLHRLGASDLLIGAAWVVVLGAVLVTAGRVLPRFERFGMAMLVAASMLLSPYVGGNSYLTVMAIGGLPLALLGDPLGIGLLVLANLPYLAPQDVMVNYSAYYWTGMLLVSAAVFGWRALRGPAEAAQPIPARAAANQV